MVINLLNYRSILLVKFVIIVNQLFVIFNSYFQKLHLYLSLLELEKCILVSYL